MGSEETLTSSSATALSSKETKADSESFARLARKQALRAVNLPISQRYQANQPPPDAPSSLDASLKKNSAMVNKLKTISGDTIKLCDELNKLKFDKFVLEFAHSIVEAAGKVKSATDVLNVCSVIHKRSSDFGSLLLTGLMASFKDVPIAGSADKADQARLNHQKAILRVLADLTLTGITEPWLIESVYPFPVKARLSLDDINFKELYAQSGGLVLILLAEAMLNDMTIHANVSLPLTLGKFYGEEFLGIVSRKIKSIRQGDQKIRIVDDTNPAVTQSVQSALRQLFTKYYDSLVARLLKENKVLRKMKTFVEEYQITRGELNEQQKAKYEGAIKSFEKCLSNVQSFADYLDIDEPELKQDEEKPEVQATIVSSRHDEEKDFSQTPWEDDETKAFYNDLLDLTNYVPPVYLAADDKKKKKKKPMNREPTEDDLDQELMDACDEETLQYLETHKIYVDDEDSKDFTVTDKRSNKQNTVKATDNGVVESGIAVIDNILLRLPNISNRKLLDELIIEFANAQHPVRQIARSQLIKTFVSVPRYRIDILPYYARFIATLHPHMPEISSTVIAALQSEFKRLFKKQHQFDLEHRIKNVRFIAELAKFKVCPTYLVFYCFKRLIQPEISGHSFTGHHVEVACQLLEGCGRFMLKTPETANKFSQAVDIFVKKTKAHVNLDARVTLLVENALASINPPPADAVVQAPKKLYTPFETFLRKLVYSDLSSKVLDQRIKIIKSMPWDSTFTMVKCSPEYEEHAEKYGRFNYVHSDEFKALADTERPPVETMHVGKLILKTFSKIWKVKYSDIHYVASLASNIARFRPDFGVQLVDFVLEDIRVSLENAVSYPSHQRRIAMVKYLAELYNYMLVSSATIIETILVIMFFGHASGRPSKSEEPLCMLDPPSDFFRVRLICTMLDTCGYYLSKGKSGKRLDDVMVYFQHYILSKNEEDMTLDIQFVVDDVFDRIRPRVPRFKTFEEAQAAVDELDRRLAKEAGVEIVQDDEERQMEQEDAQQLTDETTSGSDDSDDTDSEDIIVKEERVGPSIEEEEEFAKQFQQMVVDSVESRRGDRRAALDVAIPMFIKRDQPLSSSAEDSDEEDKVQFALLTKKGNKQTFKTVAVPSNSQFVIRSKTHQEAKREEQEQLKKLVLQYEATADDDRRPLPHPRRWSPPSKNEPYRGTGPYMPE